MAIMENLRIIDRCLPEVYLPGLSGSRQANIDKILGGLEECISSQNSHSLSHTYCPLLHSFLDISKITDEELSRVISLLWSSLASLPLLLSDYSPILIILSRLLSFRRELTLDLPWAPLYQAYKFLRKSRASKRILYGKIQIAGLISELWRVIVKAKKYVSGADEICVLAMQKLHPGCVNYEKFAALCQIIPVRKDFTLDHITKLIESLKYNQSNRIVNLSVLLVIGKFAKYNSVPDWKGLQYQILDLWLQTEIELGKYAPKPKVTMSYCNKVGRGIAMWLANIVQEDGESLQLLERFLKNFRAKIKDIPMERKRFIIHINKFVKYLATRVRRGRSGEIPEVSQSLLDSVFDLLKPSISLAVFSGDSHVVIPSLYTLCYMSPTKCLPFVFETASQVITDPVYPRLGAVRMMSAVIRPLIDTDLSNWGYEHIPSVLFSMLDDLKASDMKVNQAVVNAYGTLAAFGCLHSNLDGIQAWAEQFWERLLDWMSFIDAKDTTNIASFRYSLTVIVMNMPEEIISEWTAYFKNFVMRNSFSCKDFSLISETLTLRNPSFLTEICTEIERKVVRNGELVGRAFGEYKWYSYILVGALKSGGTALLGAFDFVSKISDLFLASENEKLHSIATKLIGAYARGLTSTYPTSYDAYTPSFKKEHRDYFNYKGGIGNQSTYYDIEASWYVPTSESFEKFAECVQKYVFNFPSSSTTDKINSMSILKAIFSNVPQSFGNFDLQVPYGETPSVMKDVFAHACSTLESVLSSEENQKTLEKAASLLDALLKPGIFSLQNILLEQRKFNMVRNHFQRHPLIPSKQRPSYDSRPYYVQKAYYCHKLRVATVHSKKALSVEFQDLLKKLCQLVNNDWSSVRAKASVVLKKAIENNFRVLPEALEFVWTCLYGHVKTALQTGNETSVKNSLEFFAGTSLVWNKAVVRKDYDIVNLLISTSHLDNPEIQRLLFSVFTNWVKSFYPAVKISTENALISDDVQSEVVGCILQICQNLPSYHLRYKLYGLIYIFLNIGSVTDSTVLREISNSLCGFLLDENNDVRETAMHTFNKLLLARSHFEIPEPAKKDAQLTAFTPDGRYLDISDIFSQDLPYTHLGWTPLPCKIIDRKPSPIDTTGDLLYSYLQDPAKLKELIRLFAVTHTITIENRDVSNPMPMPGMLAITSMMNPTKLLQFMMEGPNFMRKQVLFSKGKARLVKYLGRLYNEQSLNLIRAASEFYSEKKDYQAVIAEVFVGVFRSLKYWESTDYPVLFAEYLSSGKLSSSIWSQAAPAMFRHVSPHRLQQIFGSLKTQLASASASQLKKLICVLKSMCKYSFSWRGVHQYSELIEILKNLPIDMFDIVRAQISELVGVIVDCTGHFPTGETAYSHYTLVGTPSKPVAVLTSVVDYIDFLISKNSEFHNRLINQILLKIQELVKSDEVSSAIYARYASKILEFLVSTDNTLSKGASDLLFKISAVNTHAYNLFMESLTIEDLNWQSTVRVIEFQSILYYYNQFSATADLKMYKDNLQSKVPEIRNSSKFFLSIVLGPTTADFKKELLKEALEKAKSADKDERLYGCLLLGALIDSENDWIDPWKATALHALSRVRKGNPEITSVIHQTMSEFWKRHQSNWKTGICYRSHFSDEHAEILEDFRPEHSYFS